MSGNAVSRAPAFRKRQLIHEIDVTAQAVAGSVTVCRLNRHAKIEGKVGTRRVSSEASAVKKRVA